MGNQNSMMRNKQCKWWQVFYALAVMIVLVLNACGVSKSTKVESMTKENVITETGPVYKALLETMTAFSKESTGEHKKDADDFISGMEKDYNRYQFNRSVMDSLAGFLNGGLVYIDVYGGNWCSDTKEGMGALTRVLDGCKFPASCFRYIRVSREKKLIDIHVEGIEISKVPIVVIHNKKRELGRIVEVPEKGSWESHMLKILNKAFN